jgi:RNA polymerase sigma factor (sigma-70 family)
MTALEGKALLDHGKAIARRYARTVGIDAAEELRSEAVLRALGSPPPDGRMEPWLERIYRNLLVDRWRRGRTAAIHTDVERFATPRTPEDDLLGQERRRAVRNGLRQLPRETRRALLTRYYGELNDDVAAARLGIATATVRTRIHLRARLGDVRAWCPPILGRLGAEVTTAGLAPVLVAMLLVAGAASPSPAVIPNIPDALAEIRPPAQLRAGNPFATEPPDRPQPAPPASPTRSGKRATRLAPAVVPSLAAAMDANPGNGAPDEPTIGEILQPDGLDVFAEPERPAARCMVEPPPSFLAQIDKMMDELL